MAASVKGRPAPGPRGHMLLGSIPDFRRDIIQAFMDGWRQYGDIVKFRVAGPNYLLVHPDHIKYLLLENHRNYPHAEFQNANWRTIVGEGLVVSDGDFWLRQRRLMQPAFHRQRIISFVKLMTDTIAEMLDRWQGHADRREAIDMRSEMMQLTLNILARAMFSADVSPEAAAIGQAVSEELEYANGRLLSPINLPERFPTPANRRFLEAKGSMDRIVYRLIAERRNSKEDHGDLLSMLLNARDEETGESMNDQQLRDEVTMMFIAGHESTALALTWTWYLLAMHPHTRNRLREEVVEVLGDRTPMVEDLEKLRYTEMVLDEAMRLYPPFWAVLRQPRVADEIGGYHIPAGANVFISPYVTHRHPEFWENPEGFDPERFTPERSEGRHRYAYFAFGGGPRKCIGETFARIEMQLGVAMAAQRFRVDLVPGQEIALRPGLSLRPRHGMMMTLAPPASKNEEAEGATAG
jgi:cytochrome P450